MGHVKTGVECSGVVDPDTFPLSFSIPCKSLETNWNICSVDDVLLKLEEFFIKDNFN